MKKIILLGIILALPVLGWSTVINVPTDQPTIQAGINAAVNGDTVLVASGVYNESIVDNNVSNIKLITYEGAIISPNSSIGIYLVDVDRWDIIGFEITNCRSRGIQLDVCENILVEGCYVHDIDSLGSLGINATFGTQITFKRNIISNTVEAGIWSWGATNVSILNNTIYNISKDGIRISVNGAGCFIKNNISFENGVYGISYDNGAVPVVGAISYNDVWNNASGNYNNCSSSIGGISGNPAIVDVTGGNFHLLEDSPCIDAGDPDPSYNDLDGTRNDLGALYYIPYPQIVGTDPKSNDLNVDFAPDIAILFNIELDDSSINDTSIVVYGSQTGIHTGTINYDNNAKTISFIPSQIFVPGENVTVVITDLIKSTDNIYLPNSYIFMFTIGAGLGNRQFILDSTYLTGSDPHCTINAYLDNDSLHDFSSVNYNYDSVSIHLSTSANSYRDYNSYTTGDAPISQCFGDFNKDGYLDLAISNIWSHTICVRMNDGTGNFGESTCYQAGSYPYSLIAADFNGDGHIDISVGNTQSNTISVFINQGDGLFKSQVQYPIGDDPYEFSVGDVDLDGDLDLVVAKFSPNQVAVIFNDGSGAFDSLIHYPVGTRPRKCLIDDLNGDGYLDIVTSNHISEDLSVLLNNGDGSFASEVRYLTPGQPEGICTFDFDGDGHLDIAVANGFENSVSILWNNGDALFTTSDTYNIGDNPTYVTAADYNKDHLLDLVITNSNSNSISIALNQKLNNSPILDTLENYSVLENNLLEIFITASDVNNDSLFYIFQNNPSNSYLNIIANDSAIFLFTPDTSQSGIYNVLFIVSDGVLADSQYVEITVIDANPTIETINTDGMISPQNVTNHLPVFSWSYTDPLMLKSQVQYEIAVGTDGDWTYAEMWNPAPFVSNDTFITYNGVELIDGESYYCRIRVANSVAWSEWYQFNFRMNSIPSIPSIISPGNYIFNDLQPLLWLNNSTDAEDGPWLTYDIEIYDDIFDSPIYTHSGYTQGEDSTGCLITDPLIENNQYFWRAKAFDNYESSDWSEFASFYINSIVESPTKPVAISPTDPLEQISNLTPTFIWSKSLDVDPKDSVHYRFILSLDSLFTFATTINDLPDTFYNITTPLEYREQYWWKVIAIDNTGLETQSDIATFRTSCCVGIRGNINDDSQNVIDVSDLVYMVDYQFRGGDTPPCYDESDLVVDSVIDVADLVFMVDYQFRGGDEPPTCP